MFLDFHGNIPNASPYGQLLQGIKIHHVSAVSTTNSLSLSFGCVARACYDEGGMWWLYLSLFLSVIIIDVVPEADSLVSTTNSLSLSFWVQKSVAPQFPILRVKFSIPRFFFASLEPTQTGRTNYWSLCMASLMLLKNRLIIQNRPSSRANLGIHYEKIGIYNLISYGLVIYSIGRC